MSAGLTESSGWIQIFIGATGAVGGRKQSEAGFAGEAVGSTGACRAIVDGRTAKDAGSTEIFCGLA